MDGEIVKEFSLVSVNAGRVRNSDYRGREAVSGIFKNPVADAVVVRPSGVSGDEVADLVNHGGPDKAVCVYSLVHYPHWERVLGRPLGYGAFGENFSVDGLMEEEVHIGDVFRVGTAAVQISQPRIPCWKLAMKWGLDTLPELAAKSGKTGFYLRVLEEGTVRTGDRLKLIRAHEDRISIDEANRVMHRDKQDVEGIRRLLELREVLAGSWIGMLERRLAKLETEG
ncbi:MOSC domain-containing protein [Cohnella caldifontis]|uniref:MOSC domain-containing protein n=1 Tax=Cohnella caldifontis TaxID=3027471 RepID=UPI0023EDD6A9|nr:MOSC domain-containing protein [Cohnella sp. YIM B05605]